MADSIAIGCNFLLCAGLLAINNKQRLKMKTKNILICVLGVFVCLFGLWGGSWLLIQYPFGSGYNFASFLTAMVVFFSGCLIVLLGCKDFLNT